MREPPKLAERLVRWLVGGRDADAVAGDLRETYDARGASALWYWRQALSCAAVRVSGHRRLLPGLGQDFTHALRTIRRNPGYAVTAMVCLALALGVTATLFSLLDSLHFRKLPVRDAGRLLLVQRSRAPFCSWREYLDFRDRLKASRATTTLLFSTEGKVGETTYPLIAECVSGDFGQVIEPGIGSGRWFTGDAEDGVVLSYHFWKSRLHGDPAAIGRDVIMGRRRLRVVGIAAAGFRGAFPPFAIDLWLPTGALLSRTPDGPPVGVIARIAPGSTRAAAEAEFRVIDAALRATGRRDRVDDPVTIQPISGIQWRAGRRTLVPVVRILSFLCVAVLLIACVNVANLLLSRAAVRQREIAIRTALGASRWRLFRARLAESLVIATGATLLGVVAGEATGRALEASMSSIPEQGFRGLSFSMDARVAGFVAAAAFVAALLFTTASGGQRPARRRKIYSVLQVCLSLTLLIGAGLLLRAMQRVENTDPGYALDHRLAIELYGPAAAFDTVLDRARSVPGVERATLVYNLLGPTGGGCAATSATAAPRKTDLNIVEPNYFETMRLPIVRGDGFTAAPGVLVNETMARAWWPGEDPIGRVLWVGCDTRKPAAVVGVVRDTAFALDAEARPAYYIRRGFQPPLSTPPTTDADAPAPFTLIVQTAGDPYEWSRPVVAAISNISPDLRMFQVTSVRDSLRLAFWETRWRVALLGSLGVLAIVLAAIGLYGVVTCSVAQRTREIGVRMAIGAQPGDVQWMFLAEALRVTAIGVAAGLALSAATVRLLRGFLYGLSPFDPVAFAGASLAWVFIAMLASWWPARRATRVDPLTALKYE